jgi:hypothetical protein
MHARRNPASVAVGAIDGHEYFILVWGCSGNCQDPATAYGTYSLTHSGKSGSPSPMCVRPPGGRRLRIRAQAAPTRPGRCCQAAAPVVTRATSSCTAKPVQADGVHARLKLDWLSIRLRIHRLLSFHPNTLFRP